MPRSGAAPHRPADPSARCRSSLRAYARRKTTRHRRAGTIAARATAGSAQWARQRSGQIVPAFWLPGRVRPLATVTEILDQLLAGADTGQFTPFARALREWKSTAEIHSDPALLRRLSGPFDDLSQAVEIPMPPALPAVGDGTAP